MLATIYFSLMALSVAFIFIGYLIQNMSNVPNDSSIVFKIIGYGALFIVNMVPIADSGIQFESGNFVETGALTDTVTHTATYTTFHNLYLWIFLVTLGLYGAVLFVSEEYKGWKIKFNKFAED